MAGTKSCWSTQTIRLLGLNSNNSFKPKLVGWGETPTYELGKNFAVLRRTAAAVRAGTDAGRADQVSGAVLKAKKPQKWGFFLFQRDYTKIPYFRIPLGKTP